MQRAVNATRRRIDKLPPHLHEWYSMWALCSSQRYGQGMGMGTLVHSEIWNNLTEFGYKDHQRTHMFSMILRTDEIYREFVLAEQDRKRGQNVGTDGARQFAEQNKPTISRKPEGGDVK